MLSEVESLKLHNLKHGVGHDEPLAKKPVFSQEKVRNRRLRNLADKVHDKVYKRLQSLFSGIKERF